MSEAGGGEARQQAQAHLLRPWRAVAIAGIVVLAVAALLWLLDKVVLFNITTTYVDQIVQTFDVNRHLARAISICAFIAVLFSVGALFSLSRVRRRAGFFGLSSLLVLHSLVLWLGTTSQYFERTGIATKCYVMTRTAIRYGERVGVDPETGRPCRPVTAEILERLKLYEKGKRPGVLANVNGTFFDPLSGEPLAWYFRHSFDGLIELYDLMGHHPETGEELVPVTKDIVTAWKLQKSQAHIEKLRRPPQIIKDPKNFSFFDPITGRAKGWYFKDERGDLEFFDADGFHPQSGEKLYVVSAEILSAWKERLSKAAEKNCYMITKDTVSYGSTPGLDQVTGKACLPITPEILAKLAEYEKGSRPKRMKADDVTFFDLRTGEPVVWFSRNRLGQLELFDLMGYHPETGQELAPINLDAVETWKLQEKTRKRDAERAARPPRQVDARDLAFFDPISGEPQIWYAIDSAGNYEFFDNKGYHPRTGNPLSPITKEAISAWQKLGAVREQQRIQDKERAQRESEKADAITIRNKTIALQCDELAGNPTDSNKSIRFPGVQYEVLKLQAAKAIEACEKAVALSSGELRYVYQLARAYQAVDDRSAGM